MYGFKGFILVVAVIVSPSLAIGSRWGSCPKVPVKQNFIVSEYMGTWYEFERYDVIFERGLKCGKAQYALRDDGKVSVTNSGTKISDGTATKTEGEAYSPDPSEAAKLKVKLGPAPFYGPYWVLDTDYSTYSVVYSCTNLYVAHFDVIWILSRSREGLTDEVKQRLHQSLTSAGLDVSQLKLQSQDGCAN